MRGLIRDSLRFRILIATLLPMAFVFVTIIPVVIYYLRSGFEREIENRLLSVASLISTIPNIEYAADLREGDEDLLSYKYLVDKLRYARNTASLKEVFIFDRDGRLLVSSEGERIGKKIVRLDMDKKEVAEAFLNKKSSSVLFKGNDGQYYKNAYVPVIFRDNEVIAVLGVSASVTYFDTLKGVANGIVIIILVSLLLIAVIITAVSKGISRPVADMIRQARLISRGDYETPLKTKTYGELALLIDTFEEMRERVRNRDQEMQMMLSGIAHEIRNPLGGIQIMADLLYEKSGQDEEAIRLIEQIRKELDYLNNVVNSFLSYSRNVSVTKSKFNLDAVVDESIALLSNQIEKKHIVLIKEIPKVQIDSDPDLVKQVVINILLNSIQAVGDGGKIEIRSYVENEMAVLIIKDNGPGIKPDDLKMIFRPFFTTKEKGSGLGLALVKKYINHLNGDISVESEYGKGCEVKIVLPIR